MEERGMIIIGLGHAEIITALHAMPTALVVVEKEVNKNQAFTPPALVIKNIQLPELKQQMILHEEQKNYITGKKLPFKKRKR